jgi:CBS domain-containing protein
MTGESGMTIASVAEFASHRHPFDLLPMERLQELASSTQSKSIAKDEVICDVGESLSDLYLIEKGAVDLITPEGDLLLHLNVGNCFGERALLSDGKSPNKAVASEETSLFVIPGDEFQSLIKSYPSFHSFFDSSLAKKVPASPQSTDSTTSLISVSIGDLMTPNPITIPPTATVMEAAQIMREKNISCVLISENDTLTGILTTGDLSHRVVAAGRPADTKVGEIMTAKPFTLGPDALGFDALMAMMERSHTHLPVVENGKLVGILTNTNLVRQQAVSAPFIIRDISRQNSFEALNEIVSKTPQMLAQLVGSGVDAHNIGRIITNVTDTLTRRLVAMAEEKFGPAPVPYLWLACGSQGRQEQTGVSDQDNCLILDNAYSEAEHGEYFKQFAQYISDGLDACGYFYCPGDMMATNPRWCQPVRVWRGYFDQWIDKPDPMAQMLASVMFDLRPICGEERLFDGMYQETLEKAQKNSIFRAHMISNSLSHTPPLNLFRGFALIKKGEHKDTVDLKHNGVVPIVDLGRAYALEAAIENANTRERLQLARDAKALSSSGAGDLIDAYDLIANMRLEHQAKQIREGQKPDNFMPPAILSELERNHLKDAFIVIKTMQSALGHNQGANI